MAGLLRANDGMGRYDELANHEILSDEEKELRMQRPRRCNRWLSIASIVLLGFMACVPIFAAGYFLGSRSTSNTVLSRPPLPPIPTKSITFEKDERFSGPSNGPNDMAWGSLMPPGDGFLSIPNPQRIHYLPPGIPIDSTPLHPNPHNAQLYDTTLFHQLHCLGRIRTYLWTLKFSVARNNTDEIISNLLEPQDEHVGHCFDYIRQGLMCAGDLTLEWPRVEVDGRRFAVDGWGVGHQCRDWDAILETMESFAPYS